MEGKLAARCGGVRMGGSDVISLARMGLTLWLFLTTGQPTTALLETRPKTAHARGLVPGPDTTVISEPLDRSGFPDYVAEYNRRGRAAVSSEDNFWIAVWHAVGRPADESPETWRALGTALGTTLPEASRVASLSAFEDQTGGYRPPSGPWKDLLEKPWTPAQDPAAAAWLDAHEAVLDDVGRAARRPRGFDPLVRTESGSIDENAAFDAYRRLRLPLEMLRYRATRRMGEGRFDEAWDDLVTNLLVVGHMEREPGVYRRVFASGIRGATCRGLATWLSCSPKSAVALEARLATLRFHFHQPSPDGLDPDQLRLCEFCWRAPREVFEAPGIPTVRDIEGELLAQWLGGSVENWLIHRIARQADLNASLRYMNRISGRRRHGLALTDPDRRSAAMKELRQEVQQDWAVVRSLSTLLRLSLFGSSEETATLYAKVIAAHELSDLTLPAEGRSLSMRSEEIRTWVEVYESLLIVAFRLRIRLLHERIGPGELDGFLKSLPVTERDPFGDGSLQIRRVGDEIILSSVGADGEDEVLPPPPGIRWFDPHVRLAIAPMIGTR